jgi:hypothetical protein
MKQGAKPFWNVLAILLIILACIWSAWHSHASDEELDAHDAAYDHHP